MREILFRAKTQNGEWVKGYYLGVIQFPNSIAQNCIVEAKLDFDFILKANAQQVYTVIPETVGQFTGLTDKNGKKIFEGDIIQDITGDKFQIIMSDRGYFCASNNAWWEFIDEIGDIKIIGNIHDNPELLEV